MKEYGNVYSLIAVKIDTRLLLSHHEGERTTEDVVELPGNVERRRAINSPIPVFTSDNWDPFEEGLVNVYGLLETPPYKGRGRKPSPRIVPHPDLKYAQVCKKRVNGTVVEVVQRVVFGERKRVMELLGVGSKGKINTSYVERLNLTIRNSLARFIRRTMNSSKVLERHTHALDFFQAWYNFVKPHKSLRIEVIQGKRWWMQRTPAMAEGITDHVWTISKLMKFRVPVQ